MAEKSRRNSLAGKSTGTSKTAKYYKDNPEARKRRLAQQKEYASSDKQKKYRAELNKANRKLGSKKGDNMDASHKKNGSISLEKREANRRRNGANGRSTKR